MSDVRSRANVHLPIKTHPALGRLRSQGFTVEPQGRDEFLINGRFKFWPTTGYWTAVEQAPRGYTLKGLMEAAATP